MLTKLLTIEIDIREVIRAAEVDKDARVRLPLVVKRFFVPDSSFVKEQLV